MTNEEYNELLKLREERQAKETEEFMHDLNEIFTQRSRHYQAMLDGSADVSRKQLQREYNERIKTARERGAAAAAESERAAFIREHGSSDIAMTNTEKAYWQLVKQLSQE